MSVRAALNAILSALIAPPCAVCGGVLDDPLDGAVCGACWAAIHPRTSCFALHTITHAQAIGPYDGPLRDVLHALKYHGRRSIAPRLSALLAVHGREVLTGADLVVPVPLHPRRHRQRGFNQAEELSRRLGVPMAGALKRVKATPPQVELPAERRRENVRDAFALRRRIGRPLQGSVIVLVDDVATTGATLEACARVLTAGGAREIRALTAARVVSGPP
ncbi:MAG TPA: ComF family protein [Vicinamibacterales bacterium]|nr:ComF family protein [Vicinamibacterales bacterium]